MRRWKTLWKRFLAWIGAAALALCLLACQKTPEKPVVIQKDMEQMIRLAEATPAPQGAQAEPAGAADMPGVGAPDRIETEFSGYTDWLKVRVNARVAVPEAAGMPIYRVRASEFTEEYADRLYQWFCAGTPMFAAGEGPTKPRLEAWILETRRALASDTLSDEQRADEEDSLRLMESLYPDAPEDDGAPLARVLLVPHKRLGMRSMSFFVMERPGGIGKEFHVWSNTRTEHGRAALINGVLSAPCSDALLAFHDDSMPGAVPMYVLETESEGKPRSVLGASAPEMPYSPEEAAQKARAFLAAFDMAGLIVEDVVLLPCETGKTHHAYRIDLCRAVDGVPVYSPPLYSVASPAESGAEHGGEWRYEDACMALTEGGELYYFSWRAPLEIRERIVERANLLPFAEIMGIFEKMVCVVHEPKPYERATMREKILTIDRVTLTLQRVSEQNSLENGLLIPVWNFLGTVGVSLLDGESYTYDGDTLLSINAIDGAIIDCRKGY